MKITRDVVIDLLPVYVSGEASADTRELVDEYLASDPELARSIRDDPDLALGSSVPAPLSKDHEMQTFTRTKRALLLRDWPLFFAILFSSFAFGRIVSDTSYDVSPKNFVVTAALAALFWIVFLVRLVRRLRALQ